MQQSKSNISAVIIVKNEDNRIAASIDALSFCNEIIVVDNASIDHTVEIAQKHGAKVVSVEEDNFSTLRNVGRDHAQHEWILFVDADEIVSKELSKEIVHTIKNPQYGSYTVLRKNYYLGLRWPKDEHMLRLFRRDILIGWEGNLHESAKVRGSIGRLSEDLIHDTHRTLHEMVTKTNHWSKIEAELRIASHHPHMTSWRFFRVMCTTFYEYYFVQKGWKVGMVGIIESVYQSFSIFITYAKLWELQQKKHV